MAKNQTQNGFAMIPNLLARCGKLTPKAMAIYLCLKSHAGTSNRTWLNHKTIAREANVSLSTVKTGLNELRGLGLVSWKGRVRPTDGRQTSNNYVLHDSEVVLGRLFTTTHQSVESYQVEELFEEKILNSSSQGRARVRNSPSEDKPATAKQLELLSKLFEELNTDMDSNLTFEERCNLSRLDADLLIKELKTEKWKDEHYG